jgi:two-component system OmpR family response regulator
VALTFLARLHSVRPRLPVLLVTAKDPVEDRIAGLTAGSADYVTKSCSLEEVVARVRPRLRRSIAVAKGEPTLTAGDLSLNESRLRKSSVSRVYLHSPVLAA